MFELTAIYAPNQNRYDTIDLQPCWHLPAQVAGRLILWLGNNPFGRHHAIRPDEVPASPLDNGITHFDSS